MSTFKIYESFAILPLKLEVHIAKLQVFYFREAGYISATKYVAKFLDFLLILRPDWSSRKQALSKFTMIKI